VATVSHLEDDIDRMALMPYSERLEAERYAASSARCRIGSLFHMRAEAHAVLQRADVWLPWAVGIPVAASSTIAVVFACLVSWPLGLLTLVLAVPIGVRIYWKLVVHFAGQRSLVMVRAERRIAEIDRIVAAVDDVEILGPLIGYLRLTPELDFTPAHVLTRLLARLDRRHAGQLGTEHWDHLCRFLQPAYAFSHEPLLQSILKAVEAHGPAMASVHVGRLWRGQPRCEAGRRLAAIAERCLAALEARRLGTTVCTRSYAGCGWTATR
jgi:hypothetical protein